MECPKCGYLMDDLTTECPRCARMAQPPSTPPNLPQGAPPSYAAPGYAAPGGLDTSAVPRTSGLAIAALICGIAGLCTFGISALVGIILGLVAVVQINNDPRRLKGAGLAISGIVVSVLMVVGAISFAVFSVKFAQKTMASRQGQLAMAVSMQRTINRGLQRFHADTGVYPDTLTDIGVVGEKGLTTKVPAGSYHGPYVQAVAVLNIIAPIGQTNIPANPLVDKHDAVIAHHWIYDQKNGTVQSTVAADEIQRITPPNSNPYGQ